MPVAIELDLADPVANSAVTSPRLLPIAPIGVWAVSASRAATVPPFYRMLCTGMVSSRAQDKLGRVPRQLIKMRSDRCLETGAF